ncbi:MAG TPA: hypothetical protein VGG99_15230 [Acetobacteraceae bacterium]|jgi:hypothetical protein
MKLVTVFDASDPSFFGYWWFPSFGLLFVGVGFLLVFRPAHMQHLTPSGLQGMARRIFSLCIFVFAMLWTALASTVAFTQYWFAASELTAGRYSVVEGPVTHFVPMPYGGHADESFVVEGHRFAYSDYVMTPGFHNSASHGGPIREGLYVRIAYVGNTILRVQIAREGAGGG